MPLHLMPIPTTHFHTRTTELNFNASCELLTAHSRGTLGEP